MSKRAHKITRRKIYCPQCSTLGFSKSTAVAGDSISYKEHYSETDDSLYRVRHARVVGWVIAPSEGDPKSPYFAPAFEGVCVVALNDDLTYCYERWIKPEDILSIARPAPKFLAYFASADPKELLDASEYGSASASHTDWNDTPLPCGFPGCTAEHLHRVGYDIPSRSYAKK